METSSQPTPGEPRKLGWKFWLVLALPFAVFGLGLLAFRSYETPMSLYFLSGAGSALGCTGMIFRHAKEPQRLAAFPFAVLTFLGLMLLYVGLVFAGCLSAFSVGK